MTHFKTNLYLYALCTVIIVTPRWGFQWILTANKIILTQGTHLCWSVVFLLWPDHQNTLNHRPSSPVPSRQIYFLPYHLERSKCSKVPQFEWCPQAVESEISFKISSLHFIFSYFWISSWLDIHPAVNIACVMSFFNRKHANRKWLKTKKKIIISFFLFTLFFSFFFMFSILKLTAEQPSLSILTTFSINQAKGDYS